MKFWPSKNTRKKLYIIALILAIPLSYVGYRTIWGKPLSIRHFFVRSFVGFALSQPEMLTGIGFADNTWMDFHSGKLNEVTPELEEKGLKILRRNIEILESYDRDKLDDQELLSADILGTFLDGMLRQSEFRWSGYRLTQLGGIHADFPEFMTSSHQITPKKGADNYLKRLKAFDRKCGQVMDMLKLQEEQGVLPPRFVLERVQGDIDSFLSTEPKDNPLVVHLKKKLDGFEDMDAGRRDELVIEAENVVRDEIYPAYRELKALVNDQATRAPTDDGLWAQPQGAEYYQALLQNYTTTDMTADEIHQMGLKEVARIRGEMEWLLEGLGHTEKPFAETIHELSVDPRFSFEDSEAGREAVIKEYQAIIDEISPGMKEVFHNPPTQPVEVVPVAKFKEATAPLAYYNPPSLDGKRPGMFFANLGPIKSHYRWGMRTLAFHEAIPGHHFQYALMQNLEDVPMFRTMIPFTAFSEGWALYTEQLAWELGYQDDPYDNLGRLQAEMMRAVRLVVDTGIHEKRWTRQKALDYMVDNTGMDQEEVRIEIERYVVWPGQATAYKVGMMKILELRERAKAEMGDKFDLRDFHSVVLDKGQMPLSILEREVDAWIAENK